MRRGAAADCCARSKGRHPRSVGPRQAGTGSSIWTRASPGSWRPSSSSNSRSSADGATRGAPRLRPVAGACGRGTEHRRRPATGRELRRRSSRSCPVAIPAGESRPVGPGLRSARRDRVDGHRRSPRPPASRRATWRRSSSRRAHGARRGGRRVAGAGSPTTSYGGRRRSDRVDAARIDDALERLSSLIVTRSRLGRAVADLTRGGRADAASSRRSCKTMPGSSAICGRDLAVADGAVRRGARRACRSCSAGCSARHAEGRAPRRSSTPRTRSSTRRWPSVSFRRWSICCATPSITG